jgi:hypothetical protein
LPQVATDVPGQAHCWVMVQELHSDLEDWTRRLWAPSFWDWRVDQAEAGTHDIDNIDLPPSSIWIALRLARVQDKAHLVPGSCETPGNLLHCLRTCHPSSSIVHLVRP